MTLGRERRTIHLISGGSPTLHGVNTFMILMEGLNIVLSDAN